jgi:hypothetical protein
MHDGPLIDDASAGELLDDTSELTDDTAGLAAA